MIATLANAWFALKVLGGKQPEDAAAVLRWAGHATTPTALDAASRLGADVPFCLVGGRARVRGPRRQQGGNKAATRKRANGSNCD